MPLSDDQIILNFKRKDEINKVGDNQARRLKYNQRTACVANVADQAIEKVKKGYQPRDFCMFTDDKGLYQVGFLLIMHRSSIGNATADYLFLDGNQNLHSLLR